jgi:signal transduction histidine kinase
MNRARRLIPARLLLSGSLLSGLLLSGFLLPATHLAGQTPDSSARLPKLSSEVIPVTNGSDTIILSYGFGSRLIISNPAFRIDSTGVAPDGPRIIALPYNVNPGPGTATAPITANSGPEINALPFTATWPELLQRMNKNPRPYTFWIRCGLQNHSDSTLDISIYCGDINYIDGWFISSDQTQRPDHSPQQQNHPPQQPNPPLQQMAGGSLRPPIPGTTHIQQQYDILPLHLQPHAAGELLLALRQKTNDYGFNGIQLFSPDALGADFARDYEQGHAGLVFEWLFQGFMLCMLLYMLFQWLIIRRKEYGYYFCYIAAVTLYFLSKFEAQLGLPLLFTRFPLLKIYLSRTLLILPYFLYFRFIRSFLEIPARYPALNKWIVPLEYFLLGYMVFDFVFILITFDQQRQNTFFTFVLLSVFILSTSFIIYLFRYRQTLIYYVLTGSLVVALGNILGQVFTYLQYYRNENIGVGDILIYPQLGVLLEMLCFTAGLGYKRHMSEKEKIRSQEKLIEQLRANEQLQARMQNIRNKIAQDLHDDIGSTLSSISILSDLVLKDGSSSQARDTIGEIKDSSLMLMERMDDIVWSINPRNDSLDHLLMRVRHFATSLFEARDIGYTIEIHKNLHEVKLPMDHRQHIYLILKEAINNLVKYSRATQAVLQVQFDQHTLTLLVKDNGKGFDMKAPSGGNGIPGMQRRADLMGARLIINSTPGEGTEVLLKVVID